MDVHNTETRSRNMKAIASRNTKPELRVRSILHKIGARFRLNSALPGKPDAVLPKHKLAVFVHGCFWHRHSGCPYCTNPKTRIDFWVQKFKKNVERDKQVAELIASIGWRQLIVWECELKDLASLEERLKSTLQKT